MKKSDFKYSTKFFSRAQVVEASKEEKKVAIASLDSLKDFIDTPQDYMDSNPDLLYVAGDLWVGGMANKNDDAITVEDTIEMANQIPHKYLNLEHDDSVIVGCLLSAGFRTYGEDRQVIEDVESFDGDQISASGSGFIWRSAYEKLGDLLVSASDKDNEEYGVASFSWEVYFSDFYIMEGSKFVNEATIIKDPEEVNKRLSSLRANGGSGKYEGKEVYRLVVGPKLFLGAGIVKNPAADVEGIWTSETEEVEGKVSVATEVETKDVKASKRGFYKIAASSKISNNPLKIKNSHTKII